MPNYPRLSGRRYQGPSDSDGIDTPPEMKQLRTPLAAKQAVISEESPYPLPTPPGSTSSIETGIMDTTETAALDKVLSDEPRKSSRPPLAQSSATAPAILQSPPNSGKLRREATPYEIDDKIADVIKKPGAKGSKESRVGNNYVFRVNLEGHGNLVKIGIAAGSVDGRRQTIKHKCQHEAHTMSALKADQRPIRQYKRAEKLIHTELDNFREYFKVDISVAREATRRWTAFCEANPWEGDQLHPYWMRRLTNRSQCEDTEAVDDHALRAERWGRFTNPARWDIIFFNIVSAKRALWPLRWQWMAFFQALYLSYATFPDPVSVAWLVALVAWMLVERDLDDAPFLWDKVRTFDREMTPSPSPEPSSNAKNPDWAKDLEPSNKAVDIDDDEDMPDAEDTNDVVDTPSRKPRQSTPVAVGDH